MKRKSKSRKEYYSLCSCEKVQLFFSFAFAPKDERDFIHFFSLQIPLINNREQNAIREERNDDDDDDNTEDDYDEAKSDV